MIDAARRGHLKRLPDRIENAPILEEGLILYYDAYAHLMTDRAPSMGAAMPIPWSAIAQYATFNKLDDEQTEDLFFFVRELDKEYFAWDKRKNQTGKGRVGGRS